jgi:hypothetical protein
MIKNKINGYLPNDYSWQNFTILWKTFSKWNILSQIFFKKFPKNRHNFLEYERVFKIL